MNEGRAAAKPDYEMEPEGMAVCADGQDLVDVYLPLSDPSNFSLAGNESFAPVFNKEIGLLNTGGQPFSESKVSVSAKTCVEFVYERGGRMFTPTGSGEEATHQVLEQQEALGVMKNILRLGQTVPQPKEHKPHGGGEDEVVKDDDFEDQEEEDDDDHVNGAAEADNQNPNVGGGCRKILCARFTRILLGS